MIHKALSLLTLPLLAACVTPGQPATNLAPSEWRFVTIDGAAPVSDRARLSFTADRISASVGCNGLGGSWEARRGRLITGPFVSTMMYCEGRMEQERALAQLIESKPAYRLAGDRLTLEGGGHHAELRRVR